MSTRPLASAHSTEDLVSGRDELARVLEGVRQLPDDRREALIMRFALGMDNREIARALGRSDGATKVLIHRAISQLAGIVARDEEAVEAVSGDVERLLRRALAPVEPPDDLAARVRSTLQSISELAAEELEGWELAAMRDPRNWVRPAIALVGGAGAGAGLLLDRPPAAPPALARARRMCRARRARSGPRSSARKHAFERGDPLAAALRSTRVRHAADCPDTETLRPPAACGSSPTRT